MCTSLRMALPLACCLFGTAFATAAEWKPEAEAPAIKAELLVHTLVGGQGDQAFYAVRSKSKTLEATDGSGLGIRVRLDGRGDDPISVKVAGRKSNPSKKPAKRLLSGNGSLGGISYGYKQVSPILQQPFANGRGWKLWGFSLKDAQSHKLMADTRIKGAVAMPNGHLCLIGWCDGGNTVLHRDPKDITKRSPYMRYKYGGGQGPSVMLTEVNPRSGEVIAQAFLGVGISAIAWDPWGRCYAAGTRMCKGGKATFDTGGSGSLLVLSPDWRTAIIDARFGSPGGSFADNNWESIAIDDKQGLLVMGGWSKGALAKPVRSQQDGHGGGRDAMFAVIRLWTPETKP